jgi:site-specific DNA-methyltransferase (adenine-specific)
MELFNDDCLEKMKDIKDESIDLLFCDLPYGQTSCKWDCEIDLDLFWKEVNRICKKTTPMIFTCSVKFGNSLINSNPKNFRYDLVWVKSASCGFLNAKKMPMKKHEMIYVFYRKLPTAYTDNIELHHTHKFIKKENGRDKKNIYKEIKPCDLKEYDPPLPNSIIKTELYSDNKKEKPRELYRNEGGQYEPPLPNSVIKENFKIVKRDNVNSLYGEEKNKYLIYDEEGKLRNQGRYDPPLPNTILEMRSEKGKHSTQKPVSLMLWILKYYSRENDMVLDPTMGSGTMAIACKNLNRNFIGIEKDEKIYNTAIERINNI